MDVFPKDALEQDLDEDLALEPLLLYWGAEGIFPFEEDPAICKVLSRKSKHSICQTMQELEL